MTTNTTPDLTPTATSAGRWRQMADASEDSHTLSTKAANPEATPCPPWCFMVDDTHRIAVSQERRRHASDPVSVPLLTPRRSWGSGDVVLSRVLVNICQSFLGREPRVILDREANLDDGSYGSLDGARFWMTLDEAGQLGLALLAAVDVARELGE